MSHKAKKAKELILITVFAAIVISVGIFALKLHMEEIIGKAYLLQQVNLEDYPYPFIENYEFNGVIVVGDHTRFIDIHV